MKKNLTSVIVLVLAIIIAFPLLSMTNSYTAPIIEENAKSQASGTLLTIIPEGSGFDTLYDINDPASSTLTDVPATVTGIYQETSGLGWAVTLSTTEGYTGDPMELAVGIDTEGKISSSQVLAFPDTKEMGDYPSTFIGQDSNLPDVGLVAGVTFSSSAYKNAVSDAFTALVSNGLIGAAVKGDSQILEELMATVYPGMFSNGVGQFDTVDTGDESITGYKAKNDSGCAFIFNDGAGKLAVVNASGCIAVYDVDGNDVTDSTDAAVKDKLIAISASNTVSYAEKTQAKLKGLLSDSAELTAVPLDGVYSTVTEAYQITDGGQTYYGFAARPYAYSNTPIYYYYVLDNTGAIKAMTVDTEEKAGTTVIAAEYFTNYKPIDEGAYRDGFAGLTVDTYTGEQALVAGATFSTNASDTATRDIFEAFAALLQNGGIA